LEEEKKELIEKEPIKEEIAPVELIRCFDEGFKDDEMYYAADLIRTASYITNVELKSGVNLHFLTNWIRNGVWEKGGNPRYTFLVILNDKEIRRWDTDTKLLGFLIPFMRKEKISDLRGISLRIQKKKDERDRIYYEIERLIKKVEEV